MDLNQLIGNITPEIYRALKLAAETRKWADGTPLTEEQVESTIQTILAYQAINEDLSEPFTVAGDGNLNSGQKIRAAANTANDESFRRAIVVQEK